MSVMAKAAAAACAGLVAVGSIGLLAGCEGTTRAGTRYTLNPGRATQAFVPASVEEAYFAAERALGNLRYDVQSADYDATQGHLRAKTARNEDVNVHVERDSPNFSKVTILIGLPTIGDEDRQLMVLNNIEAELGIGPG